MRPSSGLVASERRAFGWSNLSTDGPMARNVADTALMLSVMASDDGRDPLAYTLPGEAVRGSRSAGRQHHSYRSPGSASPSPKTSASRRRNSTSGASSGAAWRRLRRYFASVEEASPDCAGADDTFAVLRASLFLAMHGSTYRERPEMLGPNVRANVEEGLGYSLEDYARAADAQTRIYRIFPGFFDTTTCCSARPSR